MRERSGSSGMCRGIRGAMVARAAQGAGGILRGASYRLLHGGSRDLRHVKCRCIVKAACGIERTVAHILQEQAARAERGEDTTTPQSRVGIQSQGGYGGAGGWQGG